MSGILFRYILKLFVIPASICFVGLSALMLLFMSFDLIGACFDPKATVTMRVVVDFLLGTLSMYLEWLLPAVFLLSTLYTMWYLCRHSELIAMRASGISMATVTAPILLVATLVSVLSFINTECYKPQAAARAMVIKNSDFRETGRELIYGVGFSTPDNLRSWTIGVFNPEDPTTLRNVRLTIRRTDGSKERVYEAPTAQWLDGAWWLLGGVKATYYDELDQILPPSPENPAQMPTKMLYGVQETPRQILVQNVTPSLASIPDRKVNRELREQAGISSRQKDEDSYQTYNHYATPVAILLVTFFAIPAGVASGRQSVFRGILLALGLFLMYYVLTALSMLLANHGILKPALAVALPSIVFGGAAIVLFRRLP